MKDTLQASSRKASNKARPDYYITPTHDFTKYTKDCEEKYWSKETAFDWSQSVYGNLKHHLETLNPEEFFKVSSMVLPMVKQNIERKIIQVKQEQLPLEEDALKDIAECIPFDRMTIQRALLIQSPLKKVELSVAKLKDHLEIIHRELLDLRELKRLGLVREETKVKYLETEAERKEQTLQFSQLEKNSNDTRKEFEQRIVQSKIESDQLKPKIRAELNSIEPQVLIDLEDTLQLVERILQSNQLPGDEGDLSRLKDLIFKRQVRGLKDIANHALVVEQSAIAPLTMGIIHYKRYREIQEAMTTFIHDEAKHSATFRRFLVEKLEAKEFISAILIKGSSRYMWLARFMPGAGLFMAVMVEAIGAAYLEFFAKEEYMPEQLFRSISTKISVHDETRHMDLCAAMYNELFRTGSRWERVRNKASLKLLLKSVYGDKNEDHHLIQAFRAFGVESELLYKHITTRLSVQLARISVYVEPEKLLEIIGIAPKE